MATSEQERSGHLKRKISKSVSLHIYRGFEQSAPLASGKVATSLCGLLVATLPIRPVRRSPGGHLGLRPAGGAPVPAAAVADGHDLEPVFNSASRPKLYAARGQGEGQSLLSNGPVAQLLLQNLRRHILRPGPRWSRRK
jgi:hypothetical protein